MLYSADKTCRFILDSLQNRLLQGDPANQTDTLVTYLYKLAFYNGRQGEAAAVSVIGFIILLICASTYMIYTLRKGDDE